MKTATRKVLEAVDQKNKPEAEKQLRTAMTEIDKALRKGVLHRNTASRKVSRLSKRVATL